MRRYSLRCVLQCDKAIVAHLSRPCARCDKLGASMQHASWKCDLEAVGRGRSLRRPARIAVSAGRSAAALAQRLCLVRTGPASVGASVAHAARDAPRPLRRGFLVAYLCGVLWYMRQLLLGARHHDALRRHAAPGSDAAAGRLQPGAGALLRSLRPGRGAGAPRNGQHSAGAGCCAYSLGCAGAGRGAHHHVPWDQLGYSQVDNALVNQLAPWTGVYGISFVLVAVNALLAGGLVLESPAYGAQGPADSAARLASCC